MKLSIWMFYMAVNMQVLINFMKCIWCTPTEKHHMPL